MKIVGLKKKKILPEKYEPQQTEIFSFVIMSSGLPYGQPYPPSPQNHYQLVRIASVKDFKVKSIVKTNREVTSGTEYTLRGCNSDNGGGEPGGDEMLCPCAIKLQFNSIFRTFPRS